jgi:hypothetical protein
MLYIWNFSFLSRLLHVIHNQINVRGNVTYTPHIRILTPYCRYFPHHSTFSNKIFKFYNNQLTLWSRDSFDTLIVGELLKNSPLLMGPNVCCQVQKNPSLEPIFRDLNIVSILTPCFSKINSVIIPLPCLVLSSGFSPRYPTSIFYTLSISHMRAICPTHLILLI